jgi:hypothetical protein
VSTLHILDLFWEVVKYDVIENVPSVKIHEWDSEDVKYWKNLELNNETSVHLSIERSESSDIIVWY